MRDIEQRQEAEQGRDERKSAKEAETRTAEHSKAAQVLPPLLGYAIYPALKEYLMLGQAVTAERSQAAQVPPISEVRP